MNVTLFFLLKQINKKPVQHWLVIRKKTRSGEKIWPGPARDCRETVPGWTRKDRCPGSAWTFMDVLKTMGPDWALHMQIYKLGYDHYLILKVCVFILSHSPLLIKTFFKLTLILASSLNWTIKNKNRNNVFETEVFIRPYWKIGAFVGLSMAKVQLSRTHFRVAHGRNQWKRTQWQRSVEVDAIRE